MDSNVQANSKFALHLKCREELFMFQSPFGKDYLYEIIYNIYIYILRECVWMQQLEIITFYIILNFCKTLLSWRPPHFLYLLMFATLEIPSLCLCRLSVTLKVRVVHVGPSIQGAIIFPESILVFLLLSLIFFSLSPYILWKSVFCYTQI